jgi:hypothetical protein
MLAGGLYVSSSLSSHALKERTANIKTTAHAPNLNFNIINS